MEIEGESWGGRRDKEREEEAEGRWRGSMCEGRGAKILA